MIIMAPSRHKFCYLPILLSSSHEDIEALDLAQKKVRAYAKVEGLQKVLVVLGQTETETTLIATTDTGGLLEVKIDI